MAKKPEPKKPVTSKGKPGSEKPKLVLVVDDKESNRRLIKMIFGQVCSSKVTFIEAGDGQAALKLLLEYSDKGTPIDAMTLDSDMGPWDGFKLLRTLRDDHPNFIRPKIIPASGIEEMREAMSEDVDFQCASVKLKRGEGWVQAVVRTAGEELGLLGRSRK